MDHSTNRELDLKKRETASFLQSLCSLDKNEDITINLRRNIFLKNSPYSCNASICSYFDGFQKVMCHDAFFKKIEFFYPGLQPERFVDFPLTNYVLFYKNGELPSVIFVKKRNIFTSINNPLFSSEQNATWNLKESRKK